MNASPELKKEADLAAMKWRVTQNPDVARRISQREEEALSLGYQMGVMAWAEKVEKLNAIMFPK